MADNTTLPLTGTGDATAVYADDDIAGVKYPRVKTIHGVNGVNDGDTARTNPFPVALQPKSVVANFTRPADTTAYAVGDVVCNSTSAPTVLTFSGMANSNGLGGTIHAAFLYLGSNPSTKPVFDLFLFDTAPTIDNDNAVFTPTDSEILNCVGVISFGVASVGDTSGTGTNMVYQAVPMLPYVCASGATALYGVLVARNAVTPTSADTYNFRLVATLN